MEKQLSLFAESQIKKQSRPKENQSELEEVRITLQEAPTQLEFEFDEPLLD